MVVHERAALPSVALPPGSSVSRHKCLGGIEYGPEREQLYGVLSAPLLGGDRGAVDQSPPTPRSTSGWGGSGTSCGSVLPLRGSGPESGRKTQSVSGGRPERPWRAPELAPEPSRPWPESGSRRENGSAGSGGSAASSRRRSGSVCASRKSAKKRGGGDAPGPEGRGSSPAALRDENR